MKRLIDIIVPVYDGYKETIQCIESVIANNLEEGMYLNVIIDCSPNQKLTEWIRDASKRYGFVLEENDKNIGFVATVNRGMLLHKDRDIILLNSDTIVAGNWSQRMQEHILKDDKVATVTPFSNNATICSFPNFCEENELLPYPVNLIDQAFAESNSGLSEVIPTAVGFCMYIRRECINQIGIFNADIFGLGYGEENDFCMRAKRLGWKHILAADVFVAHVGGVSFSARKKERVEAAQRLLEDLYPEYYKSVHDFVVADPLKYLRLRAHANLIRIAKKKAILLISHHLGGGVEKHIRELGDHLGHGGFLMVIRPSVQSGVYEFSLAPDSKDKIVFSLPSDYEKFVTVCKSVGIGLVYIHHTLGIDLKLFQLSKDLGCFMYFMMHDYYVINANPTLTDKNGRYCENVETRDKYCAENYNIPFGSSAEKWRVGQEIFLNNCKRIFTPSQYAKQIFSLYFPNLNVEPVYHPDCPSEKLTEPKAIINTPDKVFKVLVLGAISKEKGADIFEDTALLSKKLKKNIEFHLLGYAYRPLDGVIEHGTYNDANIIEKISQLNPDVIWYPILWPETYSYTLSEGLKAAYPILAVNIGAFPERLVGRSYTKIENWSNNAEQWLDIIAAFLADSQEYKHVGDAKWISIYKDSFSFYNTFWDNVKNADCIPINWSDYTISLNSAVLSKKERFLRILIQLRYLRLFRPFFRLVPMSLQKKIKRWLSRKPIHEISH